ncbi:M20/M25/M40 family metallo-hydrolase [Streptomyces sp. OM5714]|uniref:M20/M25/M40 family metallo-hydrolase n=1 Tax=Streptomyces sp. OM5714 TaxID=2602736 RepID=UPI001969DD6B|nr:M20/M25/M40 family metallo-hydrolase [Streptomyces sp. OM5714]KAF2776958.1 zinc metalloprotease (elastase)-like protein [Streptomyces sp. OM5714]
MRKRLVTLASALALAVGALTASTGSAVAGADARQAAPPGATVRSAVPDAATDQAPDIPADNLMAHLREFQDIADANGGNRAHGRPGFKASADYVKGQLDAAGFTTTLQPFTYRNATGWNVVAEWPHGNPDDVVFAGAHLDGVPEGPGINDNGSGSAAVLETALAVSRADLRPEKRLRFAWWGAEELGLIGSRHYADGLDQAELDKIEVYLNFDMVGQKDTTRWGVYSHTPSVGKVFKDYFAARDIGTFDIKWDGSSDHSSFTRHGVPVSGIGSADDPCYHSACDDIDNVGPRAMGIAANAIAHTVWELAGEGGTPARDFSVSVEPSAGSTDPGGSTTASVGTATTAGEAQRVSLTAGGLPEGATASFEPESLTSGESSVLTVATTAGTPPGTYPVTVTATGEHVTRSTTYTLTVKGSAPKGCEDAETVKSGSLTSGSSAYQPDGGYFRTTVTGAFAACLDGPDNADYDLYLQKWSGAGWTTVARGTTPAADEKLTYTGGAGYYRYRVHAYSGNGAYTLGYDTH